MNEQKNIKIGFGALCEPIHVQLKEQGFKFDLKKAKHFEKLRDCITHLLFSHILPESQIKKAYDKLFSQIKSHVIKHNP